MSRAPRLGLSFKLVVAFVAVTVAALVVAGFLIERATEDEFESYLQRRSAMEGRGQGQGPGPGSGQLIGDLEDSFLDDARSSLVLSAGVGGVLALMLGFLVAMQITRPIRRVAAAADAVAGGDLGARVPSPSGDEIGQVGAAFNRMADELQGNEEARKAMLADIAHELKTPLSVLRSNIEAMQDGVLPATPDQIGVLHDETMALTRLIDDLRTLSLAAAGHLELSLQRSDMRAFLERVVAEFQEEAGRRGITLAIESQAAPLAADVDGDRIMQALRALLDNALQYTGSGGRVTLGARGDGRQVVVSVSDTGSGIAPGDLPRIFDRFYRADASRSRTTGGSGLGLAIVKQLVEAHGGRVWAESAPGSGSTFYFSLPAGGDGRSPG